MDDDGDDKDDSKRRTRNLSEKKRRDQFNMLVNELGSMVSTNNRKMDKSTVLKSTISFLRNHNELTVRSKVHDVQEDWKPGFLSNEEFTYLVLEALEGFVIVFSATGCIYYVSETIMSLLGHRPSDMVNKSIFDLAFEDDHADIYTFLKSPSEASYSAQPGTTDNEVSFQCHLQRGTLDFREETTYERIQFKGHFRTFMEPNDSSDMSYQTDPKSRILFVCSGRLCTPQLVRDVSLVDASRNEFTSRHSLEWKFLFLDHRAPPIIGYLPFEVLGTSGYDYYHFDDLEKVVSCHNALMEKGELTSCYYRFLTKGQQWIWLQTRFYITYHQWNSKPEFVVCTHRVVSFADLYRCAKQETDYDNMSEEPEMNRNDLQESSSDDVVMVMSPPYIPATSEVYGNSYNSVSQSPSQKSTATSASSTCATAATMGTVTSATASWPCTSTVPYAAGSDTASASGESPNSRINTQGFSYFPQAQRLIEPAIVPQHGMGAQYLEPAPYLGSVGVPGVMQLPLHPLPLQRTHRELQQMIVRQQEELRQVKEQLLLARLGILQPIINVQDPFSHADELQQNQILPAQMLYDGLSDREMVNYSHLQPQLGGYHHPGHHNQNQHMPPQQ